MSSTTNYRGHAPRTHLLGNGEYSVMLTAAGSGYSRWRDIALTRWREDPTCDPYGFFVFLRDVANGQVWSAGYQPVGRAPDRYEVSFAEERAEIVRADGAILSMHSTARDTLPRHAARDPLHRTVASPRHAGAAWRVPVPAGGDRLPR